MIKNRQKCVKCRSIDALHLRRLKSNLQIHIDFMKKKIYKILRDILFGDKSFTCRIGISGMEDGRSWIHSMEEREINTPNW